MKLRMRHNSVRLRLSQNEVKQISEQWRVEEQIDFGTGSLIYALVASTEATQLQATWDAGTLTIEAPQGEIEQWAKSNQVGLETSQPIGEGKTLRLLVEKDFRCVDERPVEDADTFPHPEAGTGAC